MIASALALSAGAASAQQADPPVETADDEVEAVVVTGSLIRGTPEDAALPVDVIGQEELERQGSPTALELIKELPVSSGVLGDTNQFDTRAQGSEGAGTVNLRGLGPARTLVLLNGRRLTNSPFAGGVNTNLLPLAAIDRVEVLKDGAAATYGSDAIAGVVNFITNDSLDGFDIGGSYKLIDKSDGDYELNASYGLEGESFHFLLSAGHQHRSELTSPERDFANRPYLENPEGGWTLAGHPPSFVPGAGAVQRDPGCAATGNVPLLVGASALCAFHLVNFDNLVEKEDRFQVFSSLDVELNESHNFHIEVVGAYTAVPEAATSPSYPALSGPTRESLPAALQAALIPNAAPGAPGGVYYVPPTNPSLVDLATRNPQFAGLTTTGAFLPVGLFRPFGVGGNPAFGDGPSRFSRFYNLYRVSGGFNGDLGFGGLSYDLNAGYSQETGRRSGYDTANNRLQLALRGLGGPNCNQFTGTPGVGGCQYFFPFSNATAENRITGQANPGFNSALANTEELTNWFFQKLSTRITARLFTAEGAISGTTPITLPGGDVSFAVGAQYRRNEYESAYSPNSDRLVSPCINSLDYNVTNCPGNEKGSYVFLAPTRPSNLAQDVYALFGELQAPITDTISAQLAARFEDYGGETGSTFDPKLSVRWEIVPEFGLRASVGSTFRGPPLTSLSTSPVTAFPQLAGAFRALDIVGDPGLTPESATTYSIGAIFDVAGINATLDYWSISLEDGLAIEPANALTTTFLATPNGCSSPLAARFTFGGGGCTQLPSGLVSSANITRVLTFVVNGPKVETSGVDLLIDYEIPQEIFGGEITVGGSGSYVQKYEIDALTILGVPVDPAFDAVGRLNYQSLAYPIPQWKGQVFANFERGPHNLRATFRYIDSYQDERAPLLTRPGLANGATRDANGNLIQVTSGATIDSYKVVDLNYRLQLPMDTTLTVGIDNVFDEDPPFARLDLSYDPFTASALGRTIEIGLRKRF